MSGEKKTCANCGYAKCQEARENLHKKGIVFEDENIEVINGTAWQHICARWEKENPQC